MLATTANGVTTIVINLGGTANGASSAPGAAAGDAAGSQVAADLEDASIGTIYAAIDNYHNGCSIRVGLNQLQAKLNTPTPVKTTTSVGTPTAASTTAKKKP